MATPAPSTTLASIVIATAVVLSGAHSKDVAAVTLPGMQLMQKQADDSSHAVKIASDLHSHVDKVKISNSSDSSHQVDTRSLRLVHKKERNRLSERLKVWWQLSALYLG